MQQQPADNQKKDTKTGEKNRKIYIVNSITIKHMHVPDRVY